MSGKTTFTLDGKIVTAGPGDTIWSVALREGIDIPRLCHITKPGFRPDGNCRACVVEIEGERALTSSCNREPAEGMVIETGSERVMTARKVVFELLIADLPDDAKAAQTEFGHWARMMGVTDSRFPFGVSLPARSDGRAVEAPRVNTSEPSPEGDRRLRSTSGPVGSAVDASNPAIAFDPGKCILCTRCVRACREVQGNDVIGLAGRGARASIVFDMGDPMGLSTCVTCGECAAACPTDALVSKQPEVGETQVESVCPYCGVGCQLTYHVTDGALVGVTGRDGPANRERLCVKGRYGFDYIHHPHRLTKPLIRREGATKGKGLMLDPADPSSHFREATWEEALDKAVEGLKAVFERDGGAALAGFGSAKGSNEEAYLFQKLIRTAFGTNNVDHCTRLCHASSVAALMEGIGSGAVTAPFMEALNAEVIVVIGSNPTVNHPVAATFFKNAAERGAKLVIMDPKRQSGLSRYASHVLQFKGGVDVAMLNALMNVIVTEQLYDPAYIERHTEGFDELAEHVKAFPPEKMAEICGIDAETLREVARLYATAESAMIFWGMGISQHTHGTDNARCLIALALMCGHVGKPGTGLHPLRGQNNVQGASDAGLIPMVYPDYRSVEDEAARAWFEDFWGMKLNPNRGLTVVEIMDAILAGSLKAMLIMGENPAMSDPDADHAREALATLDHLVVQDIFLTETAWQADVVLPASAFPEKDGTFTNTDRRVQRGRQAVNPPGEARQDWWILQEIAKRLGLDWSYEAPQTVFAEMRQCLKGFAGITWERLEREHAVTYPCAAEDLPGDEVIFSEGFPTATGKARFVPAHIVPPDETPDNEYPMVLSTGRMLEHWHTGAMTRRSAVLDAIEPEPVAYMAPVDLRQKNITPGEKVLVETRRGQIQVTARADADVQPGSLFIPFCYTEGPANRLTNPALDPFGKIPEFKYCAARVGKG